MLQTQILDPIFDTKASPDAQTLMLQFLSRSMAGMHADKQWAVGLGERNSGKGVLMTLCEHAFGPYVKATNSENLLVKRHGSDAAKSLSWILDFEFKRLAFSNEIEMSETAAINGAVVKKLTSGGDTIEARRNHCDEQQIKSQAHLLILANDMPPCSPSDCLETVLHMPFPTTFVASDDPRLGTPGFAIRNDQIKTLCRQPEILDAFVWTICCKYWIPHRVSIPASLGDAQKSFVETDDVRLRFLEQFDFTNSTDDHLSVQDVQKIATAARIVSVSKQKYGKWLQAHGAIKKRHNQCYRWLGLRRRIRENLTHDQFLATTLA
jgi:hypothetical protein